MTEKKACTFRSVASISTFATHGFKIQPFNSIPRVINSKYHPKTERNGLRDKRNLKLSSSGCQRGVITLRAAKSCMKELCDKEYYQIFQKTTKKPFDKGGNANNPCTFYDKSLFKEKFHSTDQLNRLYFRQSHYIKPLETTFSFLKNRVDYLKQIIDYVYPNIFLKKIQVISNKHKEEQQKNYFASTRFIKPRP